MDEPAKESKEKDSKKHFHNVTTLAPRRVWRQERLLLAATPDTPLCAQPGMNNNTN